MELQNAQSLILHIEDQPAEVDKNWFYHGRKFTKNIFQDILSNGIKAPYLTGKSNYKYIFVSKQNESPYSSFHNYSIYPRFILSSQIKAISANDTLLEFILKQGFHKIHFTSLYQDEYQVYKELKKDQIVGIAYDFYRLISRYPEHFLSNLEILYSLSELLTEENLPLLDLSTNREINKSKVLTLKNKMEI